MEEKIINRIKRLLALSQSSNANEAASAAALAADLMVKHELEMADIQAAGGANAAEELATETVGELPSRKIETWKSILASGVASGFGCHIWWDRTQRSFSASTVTMRVMGHKSNVSTFVYMFKYLESEIERISKEMRAAIPVHIRPLAADAIRWYNSFRLGAASTISERLKQARADALGSKSEASTTALTVVRKGQDEVDEAFAKFKRKSGMKTESATAPNLDHGAVAMGMRAAKDISLGGGKGLPSPAQQIKST